MLRSINKQLMLKLSENDEWLKNATEAISDNAERLLKELEVKATLQIAENGTNANKSIAVFYKQLIDTFDIADQKINGMVSLNEEFIKDINKCSAPIVESISNDLNEAISPIISRLEKATVAYNKETKKVKRLATCLSISIGMTVLALGGIAYMILDKMC